MIKGYVYTLFSAVAFVAAVTSSQAVGSKSVIFVANVFRFSTELVLSCSCLVAGKSTFTVEKSDVPKLVLVSLFGYSYVLLFYTSTTIVPVGNLDGVEVGVYIITATFIDLLRRQAVKASIIWRL